MVDSTIKTGVDKLIDYLKTKDKVTLTEISKDLHIPIKTLQTWVDFLVEEKIISMEYKFTSPSIYLNKSEKEKEEPMEEISLKKIKEKYFKNAESKNIPVDLIKKTWNKKFTDELIKEKEKFMRLAKLNKIENSEENWNKFCNLMIEQNNNT